MKTLPMAIAMALTLIGGVAVAAEPGAAAKQQRGYVAKTERAQLAGQIVRTWAGYVQKVYGTAPKTWAGAMASTFAGADMANLRRAAKRQTYEAMTATLLGQQLTDAQAINKLARTDGSKAAVMALGSPANDLVYTMVTPCRIADTRAAGGKLVAGATRNFIGNSPGSNFAVQGGNAGSDCGIPAEPSAIAMEVTVVGTTGNGYLTVFPYGVARPLAASLNYTGVNQTLGNEIIVKQTIAGAADFSVFTLAGAHVVIDVVGYFMAPVATALQCTGWGPVGDSIPASSGLLTDHNQCTAGYTLVSGGCYSTSASLEVLGTAPTLGAVYCNWANTAGVAQTGYTYGTCCRIPGR